jgi:hypothetical protein
MTPAGMHAIAITEAQSWPGRDAERLAIAADYLTEAITDRERMDGRIERREHRAITHYAKGDDAA